MHLKASAPARSSNLPLDRGRLHAGLSLVKRICEYVYVLDLGSVIGEGLAAEVCRNQAVIDAYLGQPPGEAS